MAVTAPNYVLEESLSSQRLWKYTAGQRPPQPMEERAFFEKMWAQNFARSQVEYQMPVEVLTATTPISLNPFADINFVAEHNELSHYNLEEATERAHHHNNSNKKANPSDVAEAALMRKLNEPPRVAPLMDEGGTHVHSTMDKNAQQQKQQPPQQQVVKNDGGDTLTVLVKGDNVFGTTVSKSFARPSENGGPIKGVDTVNISVASYRVVEVCSTNTAGASPSNVSQRMFLTYNSGVPPSSYLQLTVQETWKICAIPCHLQRRQYSRYTRSLETIFRL